MSFLSDDFLLRSETARELFHGYAKTQPIYDYHCHIPPDQIAENHQFPNLTAIWLAGDHYKWRAMRTNGVEEKFITGDAGDKEKFLAWAATVPATLRNPLYHWSHLELKNYFGINTLLSAKTAEAVWDEANARLADMPVHKILKQSRVTVVCTTDDPTDDLRHHIALRTAQESGAVDLTTRMYPAFRPDKALAVNDPASWNAWCDKLALVSGVECNSLDALLNALSVRHDFFHAQGGRLSDHGLSHAYADDCTAAEAGSVFDAVRAGKMVGLAAADKFRSYLMHFFGELDAAKGWVKQLHLGALRGNNARALRELGPDTGFDSIGDWPQASALSRYLDKLDNQNSLPKTILYNLNPADNYVLGTMIGNFQGGGVAGKMQFGSGWWFLDQKEGMEWQLNTLSNLGLLSRFVGMLTDSRSFLSYPRHEYFRRVLCNLLGNDVENGELPRDMELLGKLVRDVSYENARNFFGMEPGAL